MGRHGDLWRGSRPIADNRQALAPGLVVALALALAAGIYALRTALPDANEGVTTLYSLPIALVAARFGAYAGAGAAAVSLGLFWAWASTSTEVEITAVGYVTRATGFMLLGVLLGRYAAQRRTLVAELRNMAETDDLTGLANRKRFETELESELALASRTGRGGAVLLADLNGFKRVNDTLGHRAGDDLLRQIAARFQTVTRKSDLVARLGGDEFVVLLRELDAPGARRAAERLAQSVGSVAADSGQRVGLTVGVARYDHETTGDAAELVDAADRAMYRAKHDGHGAGAVRLARPVELVP